MIGQKLAENAIIKTFKCDILSTFQTMCNESNKLKKVSLLNLSSYCRLHRRSFKPLPCQLSVFGELLRYTENLFSLTILCVKRKNVQTLQSVQVVQVSIKIEINQKEARRHQLSSKGCSIKRLIKGQNHFSDNR